MFEIPFLLLAAFIAWSIGYMVAESVWRHLVISVLALVLAGLAGASHMIANGNVLIAIPLVAFVAGQLGRAKARHDAFRRFRKEDRNINRAEYRRAKAWADSVGVNFDKAEI